MCWMGTCHSHWKSVSLQLWQAGGFQWIPALPSSASAPILGALGLELEPSMCLDLRVCRRDQGHVIGDTPRSPTHPSTSSGPHGPGMGFLGREATTTAWQGTGLAWGLVQPSGTLGMAGLGRISILSPGHPPAMSPTQGGSSSPSKDPADPAPAISITRVPTPPAPEAPGTLSPWQDTGTGHCCCRTSICSALGLLGADL